MRTCAACGAEISDEGARFCESCGKLLLDEGTLTARERLLLRLEDVMRTARQCTPYYASFNNLQQQIEMEASRSYENTRWKKVFRIGLPVALIIGIPFLLFMDQPGYLPTALPVWLLIGGWIYACVRIRAKDEKNLAWQQRQGAESVKRWREQQQKLLLRMEEIYQQSEIKDFFPQEYLYEDAVSRIISYIKTGRADTMKESLNLYESEMHRIRLEESQKQQFAAIQLGNKLQRKTGQAATFAAVMAGISILSRRK